MRSIRIITFQVDLQRMRTKIVFVGTMWYEPNRDAVLYFVKEMLPLLKTMVPAVELTVVGPGPTQDVLALSAQGNITVTGYVDDIRPYLAKLRFLLFPSAWAAAPG